MISPDELDAIEQRLANATPGPWEFEPPTTPGRYHVLRGPDDPTDTTTADTRVLYGRNICVNADDATLIAHAPADLRVLLDTVRTQREALEEIVQANDALWEHVEVEVPSGPFCGGDGDPWPCATERARPLVVSAPVRVAQGEPE